MTGSGHAGGQHDDRRPGARRRIVVVGASLAGLTTAEALRTEGFEDEILVVGAEPDLPYGRPPLSKQVLHGIWEPEAAVLRTRADLDDRGIRVRTGTRIDRLDLDARTLWSGAEAIRYDVLVIATGVAARSMGPDALLLRTLDDARVLRARLAAARRVLVVGGGVLGSEIASGARSAGLPVTLVSRSPALSFGAVGTALSDRLVDLHRSNGVDVRLGVTGASADLAGAAGLVGRADGDLVVAAIGGRPATDWLAGTTLDLRDGVRCDRDGRVQDVDGAIVPDVYAVGDVAAWTDPRSLRARRVEHQTNAIEQGLAVAATIVHGTPSTPPVPFFWSELHGVRIQAFGEFGGAGERCPAPTLHPLPGTDPDRPVLAATTADGIVTGIVGWHAARAFREARALVGAPAPAPATI